MGQRRPPRRDPGWPEGAAPSRRPCARPWAAASRPGWEGPGPRPGGSRSTSWDLMGLYEILWDFMGFYGILMGFYGILWDFNGILMGFYGILMGF